MMNRLFTQIFFATALAVLPVVITRAACPSTASSVVEVCNDAGENGTIRAYFYDGDPALSYNLFSFTTGEYIIDENTGAPLEGNPGISLPSGANAGVEFTGIPDGEYLIRVNCSPSGTAFIGGLGITVKSADAVTVTATVDPDCNPATGAGNADGSIILDIAGGIAPYDITWPTAVTPIGDMNNAPAGSHMFANLDGGNYEAEVRDGSNCVFTVNVVIPLVTTPNAGSDQTVCGPTAALSANAPASSEAGTWTGPAGVIFSPNANTRNATASNLAAGLNTLTWTITDTNGICAGVSDQVDITSNATPTVDAGAAQVICAGASATLSGTIGGSASSATWTSSGDGSFNNNTSLTATYSPGPGDIAGGAVTLTLTTDNPAGPCVAVADNVVITIDAAVSVEAGPPQAICSDAKAKLAGSFGDGAASATWTTSGDGSFSNATSPTAEYTPGPNDIANTSVTLTYTTDDPAGPCLPVSDDVVITIQAAPTIEAGVAQTICSGSTVTLAGVRGGSAASSVWTTSGDGVFNDPTLLNAVYTPGTADISAKLVTLTITTNDPTGPCSAVQDDVVITIDPAATAEAGDPQTICAGEDVTLAGSFSGSATGIIWSSSGDGSFVNDTSPNTTYSPGPTDISTGNVTLTLTTNDPSGPCVAGSDDVIISINALATADAGTAQTICAGSTVTLTGVPGGSASSGTWTSSGDGTFNDPSAAAAIYTPGTADIGAKTVTLTFTTNDPSGPCGSASDNVIITIDGGATADAGAPQTICADGTAELMGIAGGAATNGTWTTAGDGTFNDNTLSNAVYTPGPNDILNKAVTVTFTTADPTGPCPSASDNIVITIDAPPVVDAGSAQTVCSGNTVTLAGSISGSASSATWTTAGDGSFNDATLLNAIYTPGTNDVAAGTVSLTLTTDNPGGPCLAASEDVVITIDASATVNAGVDQTICTGGTVPLSGSFTGASTATWSTAGDGSFNDITSANAIYTPGNGDIASKTVTLTFTTDDPIGACGPVNDNVVIIIDAAATANAGADQTVCSGSKVSLAGSIGGSGSSGTWTTAGDGMFDDATSLTATYTPGASDLASGTVALTLTSNDPSGPCGPATSVMTVTFDDPAIAEAGNPQAICSAGTVKLTGSSVSGMATTGAWSIITQPTGGDGALSMLTQTGTPDAVDFTASVAGDYTLRLTTDDPAGTCGPATDDVVISVFDVATVEAGDAQTICANGTASVEAVFQGATGVIWTSAGDGTFDDASLANAVYTPGVNDISAESVTLTATTVGPCAPASDNVVITIIRAPEVEAGNPETICSSASIVLDGGFGGSATGLLWSTAGDGTFSDNTDPNAEYAPGPNDATNGTVTLTATATGSCTGTTEDVVITLNPAATVNAGNPQTVCDGSAVALQATIGGAATSMTWSTTGDGSFNNDTAPDAEYTPGPNDIASGSVTLTAMTNNPAGKCPDVSDEVVITFKATLTTTNANACQNGTTVNLLSLVSAVPTGGTYTFSGAGVVGDSFDPSQQSGTITVNVGYDLGGCTDNGTIEITVLAPTDPLCPGLTDCFAFTITSDPNVTKRPSCSGQSDGVIALDVVGIAPGNYVMDLLKPDDPGFIAIPASGPSGKYLFSSLSPGNYQFRIVDESGNECLRDFSLPVNVTVDAEATEFVDASCFGAANGQAMLTVLSGGNGVYEYSLDSGISWITFTSPYKLTDLPPNGDYTILVRDDASDPCPDIVPVTINNAVPAISATFNITPATCNGSDGAITDIAATGGHGAPYTFSIDGGQTFQSSPDFNNLMGDTLTLWVRDAGACEKGFEAIVTSPSVVSFDFHKENADCTTNKGSITVNALGDGEFKVALGTSQSDEPSDEEYKPFRRGLSYLFDDLSAGSYFLFAKSNTAACATRKGPITIVSYTPMDFDIEPLCNGKDFSILLTNVTGQVSPPNMEIEIFKWPDLNTVVEPQITPMPYPVSGEILLSYEDHDFLKSPGEYQISIKQVQVLGAGQVVEVCEIQSARKDFIVPEPVQAQVIHLDPAASSSYPDIPSGALKVGAFHGGLSPYGVRIQLDSASSFSMPSYDTDFAEPSVNNNHQHEMFYQDIPPGRYVIDVIDSVGCTTTLTGRVALDVGLFIPNVFTPNGDGSNDFFFIRNLPSDAGANQLVITSRWGKEVFSSENYGNNWDGTGAADGIYFYRLQVADSDVLTGWVEIIRGPKP